MATFNRKSTIKRIHTRLRKRVSGSPQRPRLCVHFSGNHIYAQLIDDAAGKTIASACTTEKGLAGEKNLRANIGSAQKIGKLIAERAVSQEVRKIVFDRGGFLYHGKVKALADAAREAGLEF